MATSFCITVEAIKDSGERVEVYSNGRWGSSWEEMEGELSKAQFEIDNFPAESEEEVSEEVEA